LQQKQGIIQSVKTRVESAGSAIATAAPSVISHVQSAVNTLSTAIPDFSIGTKEFCVGLSPNAPCYHLPPNISEFIPQDIKHVLDVNLNDIQPFSDALSRVTTTKIHNAWIIGILSALFMVTLAVFSIFHRFFRLTAILVPFRILIAVILPSFGLIRVVLSTLRLIVLHIVKSKIEHLPPWIQVEEGDVRGLSVGDLSCTIIMMVLGSIIPVLFLVQVA
jgi:hypothetical protein